MGHSQGIEADAIDRAILADTAGHYRVLDIPGFFDARRSYFHSMLGGYHAAKLSRYDDIIGERMLPLLSVGYGHADGRGDVAGIRAVICHIDGISRGKRGLPGQSRGETAVHA